MGQSFVRRLIAGTAVVGLALLGGASGNTAEVCQAVEKATNDSVATFTKDVTGKIAQAAAQGADAKQEAVRLVKEWMGDWATGIRTEADKAADPALRTALGGLAGQITASATKIKTYEDLDKMDQIMNSPEMETIGKDLGRFCPNLA